MLVLGIETSGFQGSVALARGQTCLAEQRLNQVGRRHAQSLILEIGELLRANGLKPHDIEAVAVSRGPGSFTGLRVGMVCAKTFAYATKCRFISVDTFAAIAENLPGDIRRVFVIEDAQREDLFVGEYVRDEFHHWVQVSNIQIVSTVEFLRDRSEFDVVTGPGLRKLDPSSFPGTWLSNADVCTPYAFKIAALGHRRLISGNEPSSSDTDFWQASPFYLGLGAAEEKRLLVKNINHG